MGSRCLSDVPLDGHRVVLDLLSWCDWGLLMEERSLESTSLDVTLSRGVGGDSSDCGISRVVFLVYGQAALDGLQITKDEGRDVAVSCFGPCTAHLDHVYRDLPSFPCPFPCAA